VSPGADALTISPTAYDDPVVRRLEAEVQQEYVERYGGPDETAVETCKFVSMPTTEEIKEKLRAATREDGPGRLDLSEELINRLRIGIADE